MLADCGARLLFLDAARRAASLDAAAPPSRARADRARRLAPPARRSASWLAPAGAEPAPVGDRARLAVQHHLFVGHHRHAQGHRPAARMRWAHVRARRRPAATARRGHAGRRRRSTRTPRWSCFLPTLALRRHRGADGASSTPPASSRSPSSTAPPTPCWCRCSTSASWRCPSSTASTCRSFRMKFCTSAPFSAALKADVLRALAGRAGRVLRHDRRRRHLHPRGARASRQAAHGRPARARATTSA